MPNTMNVTLLNEGGKFVTVDMKKIAKGEKCRMDKDAVVMKVGPGATAGTTPPTLCGAPAQPWRLSVMTEFDVGCRLYDGSRAFTAKTDEANKKVDDLKKQLGEKWNELTGEKK